MTGLYAGVDGGGTKTEAVVTDKAGRVLGRGRAGPSSYQTVGLDAAADAVREAVAAAMEEAGAPGARPDAACFGLSGAGRPEDVALWTAALGPLAGRIRVTHDAAAALAGALGGQAGVIVIAGTGSIAYGEGPDGRGARSGGYGWVVDDLGSGFEIGRRTLQAVLHAHDGRGPETALTARVLAWWDLPSPDRIPLKLYNPLIRKDEMAALARLCADVAAEGDPVARLIWAQAGRDLAKMAAAVIRQLDLENLPVAPVGSLWKAGGLLREPFDAHLASLAPGAAVRQPTSGPAEGAALLARAL